MNKQLRRALPLAVMGIVGLAVALPTAATAASTTNYQASLDPLNHVTGSGDFSLSLSGTHAVVTEHVHGLANKFNGQPYPHVQHIHVGAQGQCPTTSADTSNDGVISTTEGAPSYGGIGTTLSMSGDTSAKAATTLTVAPSGTSFTYRRAFTMNAKTIAAIKAGTAVVVVHGLDPGTLSTQAQGEKSDLVPSLPLAATSPALCGAVEAAQMSSTPVGSSPTGGGSTAGIEDERLLAIGGALVLAGASVFVTGRRVAAQK
jgi:hypothetical protein